MAVEARFLAVAGSIALHVAIAAAVLVLAREPIQRALLPPGAVEVGVVFTEPRQREEPAATPPGPPPGLAAASRARAPRPSAASATPAVTAASKAPVAEEPPVAADAPQQAVPSVVAVPVAEGMAGEEPGAGAGTQAGAEGAGGAEGGAAGTGAGGAGGEGGGGSSSGAPDVDQELRRRLAASAARCYPRAAQRFRAEGTTKVRFCVGEDGRARDEQVVESSGQSLLDDAALRCVIARGAPFPRTASCFTVPIHFFVP